MMIIGLQGKISELMSQIVAHKEVNAKLEEENMES